ncbi:hypothetical protein AK812_SmicGene28156 [Symbiodinium microadriaticum]|uniref:Uncharacterized protein n=1 Tax=Symbiodinium microadriaticum TaxID=2951 RepID=A0A1Q9D598_SYMMI|nr:hypothetical protein AK812_SmicGene28156 [Symbiodinium microadriaticum]
MRARPSKVGGLDYLGIADGVSGVHHLGLTPDALPWESPPPRGEFAALTAGLRYSFKSLMVVVVVVVVAAVVVVV